MKRASREIRALAVKGVQSGQYTVQQMADLTEYTAASIYNWIRVSREEDRLTAKPGGHRAPAFSADEQETPGTAEAASQYHVGGDSRTFSKILFAGCCA